MNVFDLAAKLGLDIDRPAWEAADGFLNKLRASTQALANETAQAMAESNALAAHFDRVVLDTSRAARSSVDDAAVSWDGWNAKQKKAIDWAKVWGRTVRVAAAMAFGGFVFKHAVTQIAQMGDAYNAAASRVRQLTDDVEQQKRINDELFKSAQSTGSDFGAVTEVYQQVGKAAVDSGRTLEQAVGIVDTINKGIKAGGTNAEGAARALGQLAQGLGSNRLSGEEFNSVLEQSPILIDTIAKDMGKTRGEMRKMAEAGKLTAKVVLGALERQKDAIDEAYGKRIPLVTDGFVRMRNEVNKAFGEMLQNREVAQGFDKLMRGLTVGVVGLVKGFGEMVKFFAEHTEVLIIAVTALTAAFAALAVSATSAWLAVAAPFALIAAGVAAIVLYFDEMVAGWLYAFDKIGDGFMWVGVKLNAMGRGIKRVASAIGDAFQAAAQGIRSAFESVLTWLIDKVNWAIDKINWVIDKMNWTIDKLNAAVRQANKVLPEGFEIGDIGHLDTIGHIGERDAAPGVVAAPQGPLMRSGGAGSVVVQAPATFNINGAQDPKLVGEEVRRAMDAHWDEQMTNAMDGIR